MASSDSSLDVTEEPEAEDPESDDDTEFLGSGPAEALKMNSSAEEAFSPK